MSAVEIKAHRKRIDEAQAELEELEELIAKKEKLKRVLPALERELEEMLENADEEEEQGEEEPEQEVEQKVVEEVPQVAAPPPVEEPKVELTPEQQIQKKIKALNKKLQQIEALKAKGGDLDADAKAKLGKEKLIRKQIEALKKGEDPPADESELPPKPAAHEMTESEKMVLPGDATEREKRLKALRKKMTQIVALKEQGGTRDKDAQDKINGERLVAREIEALESGATHFEIGPPTQHEKHEAYLEQKHDLERKIKAITKKLSSINDHKGKAELSGHEQSKVENEASLKKEKHELERKLGDLNRQDQLRMSDRLGDESLKAHVEEKSQRASGKKGR